MKNTVTEMTGATLRLVPSGSNVKVIIEGNPAALDSTLTGDKLKAAMGEQVTHALTVLYNYACIDEIPAWHEPSFTYMELLASRASFVRRFANLVYVQETTRNGKHDQAARCVRAILRAARQLREAFASSMPTLPPESTADLQPA